MKQMNLNENWNLCSAPLFWDITFADEVRKKEGEWMKCRLPADVRMPLMENGLIRDPVKADYCFESEWIEQKSWWFLKNFECSEADLDAEVIELVLERLDTDAAVFINGHLLGCQKSVHYPFVKEIKEYIRPGRNELIVRVTTGLEHVDDQQLSQINWAVCREQDNGGKDRSDYRRAFVRRPQYTVGWDWGPRVVTCGITGDVYIRCMSKAAIRQMHVYTSDIQEGQAVLSASVCIENLDMLSTRDCSISVSACRGEKQVAAEYRDCLLTSGDNYFDFELKIENPELWWPNGCGGQPLYQVVCSVECEGVRDEYRLKAVGIRKLTLDTARLDDENRKFQIVVNGVPIFCKGGDWIPNDSVYARVTDEKVEYLLKEAAGANFNMLRIWGGGLYESDRFYESCAEKGILVWQGFMFACSAYPDHLEFFQELVRKELDYQTKRLGNYACIALFCGSNENHWLFNKYDNPRWNVEFRHERALGLYITNHMTKEIIRHNCPEIPYWNSSPYGGRLPNDDTAGDVHRWHNGYMSQNMEERIEPRLYDQVESKFVSEYGCIGPCCLESTREYMGGHALERSGKIWEMHCNVFERNTVLAGIEKHYLDHVQNLPMEEYLLYGGMVQGHILGYSLEAMRFKEKCYGALFWMYNDTWGENGWTIIDYYLRKKISYYFVKRALSHVKFIIRLEEGNVILMGCNDTLEEVTVTGEWGYVSFDGACRKTAPLTVTIPPATRLCCKKEKLAGEDYKAGIMMYLPGQSCAEGAYLQLEDMKQLRFSQNRVEILSEDQKQDQTCIQMTCSGFAHGVYVAGDMECSDNYFDILPGEIKTVYVKNPEGRKLEVRQIL